MHSKIKIYSCFCTHHPPCLVNVKPKRESLSTDTRTPTIPNPCDVTTCPLSTETRLFSYRFYIFFFFSIFLCVFMCVIFVKIFLFVVFRNRTKSFHFSQFSRREKQEKGIKFKRLEYNCPQNNPHFVFKIFLIL